MILQSIVESPRLYSGRDRAGRSWTTLLLPEGFGRALAARPDRQRVMILRALVADMKASGGDGGMI